MSGRKARRPAKERTTVRFTPTSVRRLGCLPGRDETTWFDAETRGLALRVRASGRRSWVVATRVGSGRDAPTRKVRLGDFEELSLEEARAQAERLVALAVLGIDPTRLSPLEPASGPDDDGSRGSTRGTP